MTRRPRSGFTLTELVAVLGIAAVVGGLVSTTMSREQRIFRATTESLVVRRSARDAAEVLAEEIRGASVRDTIRVMADSAIELFTELGSSVECAELSATDIGLAPTNGTGVGLTSWLSLPDTGDLAMINRAASSTPGVWERYRIRAVSSRATSSACPAVSGLGGGAGASASSYVLTLAPAPAALPAGAPVKFIRRGRYSLYRSSDGKWYLGYRRCNAIGASVCGTIQPLSGYYQSYSSDPARTGILFRFFDSAGQPLGAGSDPMRVARVDIVTRSASAVPVTMDGLSRTAADSAAISVALRNSP